MFICFSIIGKLFSETYSFNIRSFNKFWYIVIFGGVAGLRHISVGTDTELYAQLFLRSGKTFTLENFFNSKYPVYDFYSSILYRVNDNTQIMIFVNSLIIIWCVGYFINKVSLQPFVSYILYITLYFYFTSMNISRQYLAVSFLLLGVTALLNKKEKIFFVFYVLAALTHSTAIIGIVFFILFKIKWNNKKYAVLTIICTLGPFFIDRALILFVRFFPAYEMYGNAQSTTDNIASQSEGNKIILSLFYLVFLIVGLYIRKYIDTHGKKKFDFMTAIAFIGVIIGILFYNNILISRMEMYFTVFFTIYIAEIVEYFSRIYIKNTRNKSTSKALIYFTIILISLIPMFFQLNKGLSGVTPYKFFWNS
ncbi:EpsG family protein [Enterococcus casseliflavus]|uniref:EpsG family protein n=1 Tax=Enterococcus casseliflavus TaxID=37734 RepID=UPI0035CBB381